MSKIVAMTMGLALVSAGAFAQTEPPNPPGAVEKQTFTFVQKSKTDHGDHDAFYGPMGTTVMINITDSEKTVKGAPYTATAITETTQVLSDGNRILRKTTSMLARDSQGRTREEISEPNVGSLAVRGRESAFINDPTSGTVIVVAPDKAASETGAKVTGDNAAVAAEMAAKLAETAKQNAEKTVRSMRLGETIKIVNTESGEEHPDEIKHETLGTQTIEGISAEGKRETRTIPAGAIGNERPIEVVTETWFSPDLQVTVMSKRSDPRFGETVYRLTEIKRVEPDPSLFQVHKRKTKPVAQLEDDSEIE
ncbi:MAG TPA: hypothetical protein VKZ53_09045 [Candidatus Angelobacter sp.]|nr:hypothetical protein [Candidatus Angelobacter sp.]